MPFRLRYRDDSITLRYYGCVTSVIYGSHAHKWMVLNHESNPALITAYTVNPLDTILAPLGSLRIFITSLRTFSTKN